MKINFIRAKFLVIKFILPIVVGSISLTACQNESAPLMPAPKRLTPSIVPKAPEPIVITPTKAIYDLTAKDVVPKLDIIIVIDDSASMKPHIANLERNLNHFVEAFSSTDLIDFHIGVLPIWDSTRYHTDPVVVREFHSQTCERNFHPKGHMLPIYLPGEEKPRPEWDQNNRCMPAEDPRRARFISKSDENFTEALRHTLNTAIAIQDFQARDNPETGKEAFGPEIEELFSPIFAALNSSVNTQTSNEGLVQHFRRPDAHLAILIVSDADDESAGFSPERVRKQLLEAVGNDPNKLSVYAVLHPDAADTPHTRLSCPRDPSGAPVKVRQLLSLIGYIGVDTNGRSRELNICSRDFGPALAEVGQEIKVSALETLRIPMDMHFDITSIEVRLGDQLLIPGEQPGWTHDPESNSLVLRRLHSLESTADSTILTVDFEPVNPAHGELGILRDQF